MKNILIALVVCVGLICTSQASAEEVVKKKLSTSVKDAVQSLEKDIKDKELELVAKIDHWKAARDAGFEMPPATLVMFGDPELSAALMNADMAWSYELPLKISVYEDADGVVWAQTELLSEDIPAPGQEKNKDAMNVTLTELVEID